MEETLFKFCVVRPPMTPDTRYPPLDLGQPSDFQASLAKAAQDPNNPRLAMDAAANSFIATAAFVQLDATDSNNILLEKAALALDNIKSEGLDHGKTVDTLTAAFGASPAGFQGETWVTTLESNLKDSIVAMRQLGLEATTGHLADLTRRLRTIDAIHKIVDDNGFPFDDSDLVSWRLRPILAPTLMELKSILSTAQEITKQRQQALDNLLASQARANALFQQRIQLASTMKAIIALPASHRVTAPPVAPAQVTAPANLSISSLAQQHLAMINQFSSLAVRQYEQNIDLTSKIMPLDNIRNLSSALPNNISERNENAFSPSMINPSTTLQSSGLGILGANPIDPSPAASLVSMSKTLFDQMQLIKPQTSPPNIGPPSTIIHGALQPTALQALPESAVTVLQNLNIDVTAQPVDVSIRQLQSQMSINAASLDNEYRQASNPVAKVSNLGGVTTLLLNSSVSPWGSAYARGDLFAPQYAPQPTESSFGGQIRNVTVLGFSDLIVAKQQLVSYEKVDVAYVENVLKGEKRIRELTTSEQTETTTMLETETTTTTETDTSTADRFETATESDKAMKENESLKAGVTVSASYGPAVHISANASGATDRNKSESSKASSKYSRDVTNKASQKIEKRVLQRVTTKTTTSTVEKESHTFDNTQGKGNISGVYQWLNKNYQAQNWYYGQRVMLDFMLPEPGAFLLDKIVDPASRKPDDIALVPAFTATKDLITRETYAGYAADLGVEDIPAPPALVSRKAVSYASGPSEEHWHSEIVALPAGFSVSMIYCQVTGTANPNFYFNWVEAIAASSFKFQWYAADPISQWSAKGNGEQNEVAFSVTAEGMSQLSCNVEFELTMTQEAFDNWQSSTYIKLKTAHEKLVQAQNDAIKQAKFESAVSTTPTGQNPAANLVVMRNEMKKMCIETITDQYFDKFSAIKSSETISDGGFSISEIDIDQAWKLGPVVRFFEEAFEWEEMTWLTYPYFWGRKEKWFEKIEYEDDDPVFQDFMRAGFARANTPVRPGWELAVDHFLSTGRIWNGGTLPGISSSLFLPLAAEIQESLGKRDADPVPYPGGPWPVSVPTNLIKLRADDQTPVWSLKGNEWVEKPDVAPAA